MITLTIKDLKSEKVLTICHSSPVEAEKELSKLITDPKKISGKKGRYLEGWSYDSAGEMELIEKYLPETRRKVRDGENS